MFKRKRIIWGGYLARMAEKGNTPEVLIRKLHKKRPL
jgi:hypothetical protein